MRGNEAATQDSSFTAEDNRLAAEDNSFIAEDNSFTAEDNSFTAEDNSLTALTLPTNRSPIGVYRQGSPYNINNT